MPRNAHRLTTYGGTETLERDVETKTLVYDKENVSRKNQKRVDSDPLHYVTSLTAACQHVSDYPSRRHPLAMVPAIASTDTITAGQSPQSV